MVIGVIERMLLLAVVFFAEEVMDGKSSTLLTEKELLVEEKLNLINKPAVKSIQVRCNFTSISNLSIRYAFRVFDQILVVRPSTNDENLQSEDGDTIDCVDVYKQPAFDHPQLKHHTIQMRPSDEHFGRRGVASCRSSVRMPAQVWQRSGSCPNGTVPILRVQERHLLNAPSITNYGRKPRKGITELEVRVANQSVAAGVEGLHAVHLRTPSFLHVSHQLDIIWLTNGEYNNSDSIEVGWMVSASAPTTRFSCTGRYAFFLLHLLLPILSHERRVKALFQSIEQADSGKTTGCFNLLCAGFVQTSSEIALGGSFSAVSTFDGRQYEFLVNVWRDFDNGRWWLMYGENVTVGYWPVSLFRGLSKTATVVVFGGDVYSPRMKQSPHTATAMGSGSFSSEHFGRAAFIGKPRIKDYSGEYKYPYPFGTLSTQTSCYSAENYADILWTEPLFYYGGPGRSYPYCQ
ncbi:hypothetical protein BHE74_00010623 [Ensete ventricosum]|nr:hypothetical protein BHE74_00010623 [Ensete ventricosum]